MVQTYCWRKRSLGHESAYGSLKIFGFSFERKSLGGTVFLIKVVLLYNINLGLRTQIILCAIESSVPDSSSQAVEWGGGNGGLYK